MRGVRTVDSLITYSDRWSPDMGSVGVVDCIVTGSYMSRSKQKLIQ